MAQGGNWKASLLRSDDACDLTGLDLARSRQRPPVRVEVKAARRASSLTPITPGSLAPQTHDDTHPWPYFTVSTRTHASASGVDVGVSMDGGPTKVIVLHAPSENFLLGSDSRCNTFPPQPADHLAPWPRLVGLMSHTVLLARRYWIPFASTHLLLLSLRATGVASDESLAGGRLCRRSLRRQKTHERCWVVSGADTTSG